MQGASSLQQQLTTLQSRFIYETIHRSLPWLNDVTMVKMTRSVSKGADPKTQSRVVMWMHWSVKFKEFQFLNEKPEDEAWSDGHVLESDEALGSRSDEKTSGAVNRAVSSNDTDATAEDAKQEEDELDVPVGLLDQGADPAEADE